MTEPQFVQCSHCGGTGWREETPAEAAGGEPGDLTHEQIERMSQEEINANWDKVSAALQKEGAR